MIACKCRRGDPCTQPAAEDGLCAWCSDGPCIGAPTAGLDGTRISHCKGSDRQILTQPRRRRRRRWIGIYRPTRRRAF